MKSTYLSEIMNSMKLVTAPIIFGKMHFLLISENEFFHQIKCNRMTNFMEFMYFLNKLSWIIDSVLLNDEIQYCIDKLLLLLFFDIMFLIMYALITVIRELPNCLCIYYIWYKCCIESIEYSKTSHEDPFNLKTTSILRPLLLVQKLFWFTAMVPKWMIRIWNIHIFMIKTTFSGPKM